MHIRQLRLKKTETDLLLVSALLLLDLGFELLHSSAGDTFPLNGCLCFQIIPLYPFHIVSLYASNASRLTASLLLHTVDASHEVALMVSLSHLEPYMLTVHRQKSADF